MHFLLIFQVSTCEDELKSLLSEPHTCWRPTERKKNGWPVEGPPMVRGNLFFEVFLGFMNHWSQPPNFQNFVDYTDTPGITV